LRGLIGLSEAVAIPAGMKVVAEWFPDREKSVAVGYFNAGTSLGSLLAPPLVVFLSLRYGWQSAFAVTGALGFFWAAAWYLLYRSPADHTRISEAERDTISRGQTPAAPRRRSVREVLSTRHFWAIAQARFFAEPAWQTFSFWIPLYLATQRHMDLKQIALFAWLPFLAADLGGLFGGYLSPFLMKHLRMPLIRSRITGVVLGALMMLGSASIGLVASPYQAIALFCVGGFAHQMISALVNTLAADVFDPSEVGTVAGCGHGSVDRRAGLFAAGRRAGRFDRIHAAVRRARRFRSHRRDAADRSDARRLPRRTAASRAQQYRHHRVTFRKTHHAFTDEPETTAAFFVVVSCRQPSRSERAGELPHRTVRSRGRHHPRARAAGR
jgi:sugar phosphate permease